MSATQKAFNVSDMTMELSKYKLEAWLNYEVFAWQWWLGVALFIVPWILWIKYRRRESTDRLLYAGFFVMIVSIVFDSIGTFMALWYYIYEVIPFAPAYVPWDISLMPVTVMFLIQYKPEISPYLKAILFAFFASFIAEPFFIWIDLYKTRAWEYIYSLPIHIVIYLIAHYLSKRADFTEIR